MSNILLLGGARSGKSRYALELAKKIGENVLFVATATPCDEEMRERIESHRNQRPCTWRTIEATHDIGNRIEREADKINVVVVDCITLLVAGILNQQPSDSEGDRLDARLLELQSNAEIENLITCMKNVDSTFILVSNEVGQGLVPPNRIGRLYRDMLGRANQTLAQFADEVYLMIAGLPVALKKTDSASSEWARIRFY